MYEIVNGIKYEKPQVFLLQETGLGAAELAGRIAYDSFDKSENDSVVKYNEALVNKSDKGNLLEDINNIESSNLLYDLAHTYFHHSVLEHISLNYLIKGTSRGVLQEMVRHRIASYTVRSTRYTMAGIINAFNSCDEVRKFIEIIKPMNMFVVQGAAQTLEIEQLYAKLSLQFDTLGPDEFLKISATKKQQEFLMDKGDISGHKQIFNYLQSLPKKRNVGDAFKWVVTDTWKVDMVVTFNVRSLRNYFTLRDSGAAFFQIRWLAKEMKAKTPQKYINLIDKKITKKLTEAEQTEKDLNELKRLTEKLGMTAKVVTS